MTQLVWDVAGAKNYESGVDRGVLYIPDGTGAYSAGYAWNGLTGVNETPSGATPTAKYADNTKYLNLLSIEEFAGEISAYTYPDQFAQCDGSAAPAVGVSIGQQPRHNFGLSYRTKLGNDVAGLDNGYKLHLVYGALAEPAQKQYASVNATPDAIEFKWKFSTTPVAVTGLKNSAILVVDSTKVTAAALAILENFLYGAAGAARLPLPDEVVSIFSTAQTSATPTQPVYTSATHTIAIPAVTGVSYYINGVKQSTGNVVLTAGQQVIVTAQPNAGYYFPANTDNDWEYIY